MREQILEAAVQLLGQHGPRKLTGPQVAKKAKVRQSHLTYYFPRRSDLIGAVARRYIESVAEQAMALSQQGRSTDGLITAVLGDRRRVRTLISLLMASDEDPALGQQLIESVLGTRSLIAAMLGLPPAPWRQDSGPAAGAALGPRPATPAARGPHQRSRAVRARRARSPPGGFEPHQGAEAKEGSMKKMFLGAALLALCLVPLRLSAQAPHRFTPVQQVLQHPRCMNCHPAGDAPLQTDQSRPHQQNIKRVFGQLGGSCQTCHQESTMPGDHMPPGAPHWGMPSAATPMTFQGKSATQLCLDVKDPAKNGNRSLGDLRHHVEHDPLVVWAFNPGQGRTPPPLSHPAFLAAVDAWIAEGAPCP